VGTSIVFDQAAEYYDDTRGLSPATQEAVIGQLARELDGRGRCLEVGVGTGRIALDLQGRGIDMAGVDLSTGMLRKLVEKAGGRGPFPLAVADATALPFGDRSMGGAVVCHVLHLIPTWRRAVDELVRVVRPGGLILVESARRPGGAPSEVARHFWSQASPAGRPRRGLADVGELDPLMEGLGFRVRLLPPVVERSEQTLDFVIERLEAGIFSACWGLGEAVRRSAAEATREWARARYDLAAPHPYGQTITWRAYAAPGG